MMNNDNQKYLFGTVLIERRAAIPTANKSAGFLAENYMTKKKKRHIYKKKLSKECWDLDLAFLKWLQEHLPVYLKDAEQIVDLTYYKFTYNNIEYTQKDLIIHMIKLVNEAVDMDMYDEKYSVIVDEILDLWKMVFYCMWW